MTIEIVCDNGCDRIHVTPEPDHGYVALGIDGYETVGVKIGPGTAHAVAEALTSSAAAVTAPGDDDLEGAVTARVPVLEEGDPVDDEALGAGIEAVFTHIRESVEVALRAAITDGTLRPGPAGTDGVAEVLDTVTDAVTNNFDVLEEAFTAAGVADRD